MITRLTLGACLFVFAAPLLASEAAPDPTPLLWDRVRQFDAVIVATMAEGFEKNTSPVKDTNCVYVPIKIEKSLKGDLKGGDFRMNVHGSLPALLAERDKDTPRRYVLVIKIDRGAGVLMSGQLWYDLMRFLPADKGLEKVVVAFAKAADEKPATVIPMAIDLLADKDTTPAAAEHVNLLLAKVAKTAKEADWKAIPEAQLQKAIDVVAKSGAAGSISSAAAALLAVSARHDNPATLKLFDSSLAAPGRKFLADRIDRPEAKFKADYYYIADVGAVAELLGKLRDKDAKDVLLKVIQSPRWRSARPQAIAAVMEIFGDKAGEILKPVLENLPADPPKTLRE